MNQPSPLARLMALAFHLNLAMAAAMVLWTAWTGYLLATGQIHPATGRALGASPTLAAPMPVATPDCACHRRVDELHVRGAESGAAA